MKLYGFLLLFITTPLCGGFITTHPRFVGLHPASLKNISTIINQALQDQKISGAIIYATREEKVFYQETFEQKTPLQKEPITINTQSDLGSLAHLLVSLPSLMLLVERGLLCLADPIINYRPNFANNTQPLNVAQVMSNYPENSFEVLSPLVQHLTGIPLETFVQESVFKPLGMDKTIFMQPEQQLVTIAQDSIKLFSTAHNLALFLQMILNHGTHEHKRIMSPVSVKQIISVLQTTNNQIPQQPVSFLGDRFMPQAFGFLSNTGMSFILDPESKICLVMLFFGINQEHKEHVASLIGRIVNIIAMSIKAEFKSTATQL